jgi:hypothetical protein
MMIPVRAITLARHFKRTVAAKDARTLWTPCSSNDQAAESIDWQQLPTDDIEVAPLTVVIHFDRLLKRHSYILLVRCVSCH